MLLSSVEGFPKTRRRASSEASGLTPCFRCVSCLIGLPAALFAVLAVAARPAHAVAVIRAQGGIQVIAAPAPIYSFANSITFTITAQSDANLTGAALLITSGGGSAPVRWP